MTPMASQSDGGSRAHPAHGDVLEPVMRSVYLGSGAGVAIPEGGARAAGSNPGWMTKVRQTCVNVRHAYDS